MLAQQTAEAFAVAVEAQVAAEAHLGGPVAEASGEVQKVPLGQQDLLGGHSGHSGPRAVHSDLVAAVVVVVAEDLGLAVLAVLVDWDRD